MCAPLAVLTISQGLETSRRTQTYGRRPEELHIPPDIATGQSNPKDLPRHHSYHASHEFSSGQAPGISVQQATLQGSHYTNVSGAVSLPGSLQPGRPGVSTSITAPSTIPTLPQIQNPPHQHATSSRPPTASHTHSYSRSSPAGMDQTKYAPYADTPENAKFATPPSHRYTSSQTAQGDSAYSPLGLADIRPIGESGMDGPQTAVPNSNDGYPAFASNSNYLAPWPVYAFDWCKWPVPQQSSGDSAGKIAIGSYVEDGHNFVSARSEITYWLEKLVCQPLMVSIDTNTGNPDRTRVKSRQRTGRTSIWPRVRQNRRSNTLVSRYKNTLGASIITKAIH